MVSKMTMKSIRQEQNLRELARWLKRELERAKADKNAGRTMALMSVRFHFGYLFPTVWVEETE